MKHLKLISVVLFFILTNLKAQNAYWKLNKEKTKQGKESVRNNLNEESYQLYTLDINVLKSELEQGISSKSGSIISFPNQYGKMEKFSIYETSVLAPHIAVKYPNIKTYRGYGVDNSESRIRFSITPQGIQAMTTHPNKPSVYTVPTKMNTDTYISYDPTARKEKLEGFECLTDVVVKDKDVISLDNKDRAPNDQTLRIFRIAISTTGEYTQRWNDGDDSNGIDSEDAFAQVVSSINRMNEIYEVDMAIRFQLVTGAEIVYPNALLDPYDDDDTNDLNEDLQITLSSMVGEENYDIGHLFHVHDSGRYKGDAGCIGCVCEDGAKGSGYSSHNFLGIDGGLYMTDYFDADILPHEIGHQMGANHTFSFRNEGHGVNVEPGRGSTLMGYAGSSKDDLIFTSLPYFHYMSIEQVLTNITSDPNNCWTSIAIPNSPPIADAGIDYTIPAGTAFVLDGSKSIVYGNPPLYTWEQIDDGVTTYETFGPTVTGGPMFRSKSPSSNPKRFMPNLLRIILGNLTETNPSANEFSWETVPTVTRFLNFALTVRDDVRSKGRYPQVDSDVMIVLVEDTGSPFAVTSQATSVVWEEKEIKTVTWDVAGTDGGTINTPTVNILLSTDGGYTYPYLLASNVSNDGSHDITVPEILSMQTTTARVMVEGNNNIFFAINSTNFTVQNATASLDESSLNSFRMFPNPSSGSFHVSFDTTDEKVSIQVSDLKGTIIKNLDYNNVGVRFSKRVELDAISKGLYIFQITNGKKSVSKKILIE